VPVQLIQALPYVITVAVLAVSSALHGRRGRWVNPIRGLASSYAVTKM
jgi:hypothetical protein